MRVGVIRSVVTLASSRKGLQKVTIPLTLLRTKWHSLLDEDLTRRTFSSSSDLIDMAKVNVSIQYCGG